MTSEHVMSDPNELDQPLPSYLHFHTSDVEQAEADGARLLSVHRLAPCARDQAFTARAHAVRLPLVSLYYMNYSAELTVDAPPLESYVAVTLPLTGHMRLEQASAAALADAGRGGAILSAQGSLHMRWSCDFSMFCLKMDLGALTEALRALVPAMGEEPLRFSPQVTDSGAVAALFGAARLMQSAFETAGSAEYLPTGLARQLQEHAMTTLLTVQPHNYTDQVFRRCRPVSSLTVRRATDLIEGEEEATLTVGQIASRTGVSVRALELGFRRQLDVSPSEYLRQVRLRRSHDQLSAAAPGDATVAGVAMRWGFAHAGRFAAYYRARYGCSPSETLRRA